MLPTAEMRAVMAASGREVKQNTALHWARRYPGLAGRYDKRTYAWHPLAVELLAQGIPPAEVAARVIALDQGEGN